MLTGLVLLLGIVVWSAWRVSHWKYPEDGTGWFILLVFSVVGAGGTGLIVYDQLYVQVFMRTANPAYYALEFLKLAVK
jgi:hypothetical protein